MPKMSSPAGPHINLVRAGPRGSVPVVFLHALGLDLTWWDGQIAEFGRDHDVIALDLPGHGRSDGLDAPATFAAMAGSVANVLSGIATGPVHLVGLSVGGMIAQTLAVTRPELVRSLTLVATSCTFSDAVRQLLRERAQVACDGGMKAIGPMHLERWFPELFRERRPDVLDRALKCLLLQDPDFHASLWDMVAGLDLQERLSGVRCPTMVMAGGDDASASPAAGQLIVQQIDGAAMHVFAGCGHFPPVEVAKDFNDVLRAFLNTMQGG